MKVTSLSYYLVALSFMGCGSDDPDPAHNSTDDSAAGATTTTGTTAVTSSASNGATTTSNSSSQASTTGATGTGTGTGTAATGSGTTGTTTGLPQTSATGMTGAGGTFMGTSSTGTPSTTAGTSTGTGGGSMTSTATGAGGNTTTGGAATTGGVAACESGPLDAPLPNCSPEPVPDTGDYYADCVARINQFRWECQCLPPLDRWEEGEDCADQMAEYDYQQGMAHAGIRAKICEPSNAAQNECPDYGPSFGIVDFCLQQMWDEGPGEPFEVHGHYINMSDPNGSRVACGMYVTPEGNTWAVQNFQ